MKLYAIDIDGTLCHDDGSISTKTKRIIQNMNKKNFVVICTARPRYHALKINALIGNNSYIISSNGAEIYDIFNKKKLYSEYISKNDCKLLYTYAKDNDIRIIFGLENAEYATKFIRNNNQKLLTDDNLIEVINGNVKQIMIIDRCKIEVEKFKQIIYNSNNLSILDYSNTSSDEAWFSIVNKNTSKGIALNYLANYLKININDTIVFGNDNNDISMFKIAGKSIAISNATKELLLLADEVTLSNNEDGVAFYLEKNM